MYFAGRPRIALSISWGMPPPTFIMIIFTALPMAALARTPGPSALWPELTRIWLRIGPLMTVMGAIELVVVTTVCRL